MKKRKMKLRIATFFLALVLLILSFPLQSMAEFLAKTESYGENTAEGKDTESAEEVVYIVSEDRSKRGEFEKHYYLSDGSFTAVTYTEAVHYLDENGEWQDIDYSLSLNENSGAYESENGDFKVAFSAVANYSGDPDGADFAKENAVNSSDSAGAAANIAADSATPAELISLKKDSNVLSWTLTANKTTAGTILSSSQTGITQVNNCLTADASLLTAKNTAQAQVLGELKTTQQSVGEVSEQSFEKVSPDAPEAFALPLVSNKVEYSGIFGEDEGISVRYTVYQNRVEEDIFIERKTDIDSFSMSVECGDLRAVLNEDNSVDFLDVSGEMAYHVSIPYMVDAAYEVLNDIEVTLKIENGRCIITYTPDSEWMNSEDRVYPIMLDPSVTTNEYSAGIIDTYVEENSTVNHEGEQYLYINKNGSNRRKAVLSIQNVPTINDALPIISAKLNVTTQYGPLTDIPVKLEIVNSAYLVEDATYANLATVSKTTVSNTYVLQYQTGVTFDISSEFANGLYVSGTPKAFVISLSDENSNDYCYPINSSEVTNAALRPNLTVKYGYTLPAGLADGNVISIENVGSGGYLYPSGGFSTDGSNIVHYGASVLSSGYQFVLQKNSETGGYSLKNNLSPSANVKITAAVNPSSETERRLILKSSTDTAAQEWLIVPYDYDTFKIVLRSDMRLAMTAVGTPTGSNYDTTTTTNGHVIVSMSMTPAQNNQLWYIVRNGTYLNTGKTSSALETGDYYFNNAYTGKFLHRSGNTTVNGQSGLLSSLGESSIKWHVTNLEDGYCTIQRADMPNAFLAADSTSSSTVKIKQNNSETISDIYKWEIRIATGGGCLIKSKYTGKYLYSAESSSSSSSVYIYGLYSSGSTSYDKQRWRVVEPDEYKELTNGVSFDDLVLEIDSTKSPSVNKSPSDALWANLSDFTYTLSSGSESGVISISNTTQSIIALDAGLVEVKAVHKVTGITRYFDVTVIRTFSDVLNKMSALYNAALQYNSDTKTAALLTLQFIRRGVYNNENWEEVAGEINTQFVSYIQSNYLSLYSYFTVSSNEELYFDDPNDMGSVDFVHLCATLNGLIYDSTSFKSFVAGEANVDNLCGWAGDLQTLCIDVLNYTNDSENYNTVYNATLTLLGTQSSNESSFSMSDLLADVDAYNIYNDMNSSCSNFVTAFEYYYVSNYTTRFTDFTNNWQKTQIYNCVRKYTTNTFVFFVDWPLLNGYEISDVQADAIAAAFTDYIWGLIQDEI